MCFKAFQSKDVSVILSVGKQTDIASFGEIPDNFYVCSFVNQIEVLKNASLFITHGGTNSVNEAISFGVPMVVIPLMYDQPIMARQIDLCGLGRALPRKKLTASKLSETTFSVLSNSDIQKNAKDYRAIMQSATGNKAILEGIKDIL